MNYDKASEIVIELARRLVSLVQAAQPKWTEAYWRFESEEARYGSNASYVTPAGVELIGAIRHGEFFDAMNELGRKLWLSEPDYKIYFERQDIAKWRITKLDGASGRPMGLDVQQSVAGGRREDALPAKR